MKWIKSFPSYWRSVGKRKTLLWAKKMFLLQLATGSHWQRGRLASNPQDGPAVLRCTLCYSLFCQKSSQPEVHRGTSAGPAHTGRVCVLWEAGCRPVTADNVSRRVSPWVCVITAKVRRLLWCELTRRWFWVFIRPSVRLWTEFYLLDHHQHCGHERRSQKTLQVCSWDKTACRLALHTKIKVCSCSLG